MLDIISESGKSGAARASPQVSIAFVPCPTPFVVCPHCATPLR